jgi:hypothetical protein
VFEPGVFEDLKKSEKRWAEPIMKIQFKKAPTGRKVGVMRFIIFLEHFSHMLIH